MSDRVNPINHGEAFQTLFKNVSNELPGNDIPQIVEVRQKCIDNFVHKGLPTKKNEAWVYTDLNKILRDVPSKTNSNVMANTLCHQFVQKQQMFFDKVFAECNELSFIDIVFFNGVYMAKDQTLPKGITIETCADIIENSTHKHFSDVFAYYQNDALSDLSRAFLSHGVVVTINNEIAPNTMIRVIYDGDDHGDDLNIFINNLFIVEDHTKICIADIKTSQNPNHAHYYIQQRIRIGSSACLERCRIVDLSQHHVFIVQENHDVAEDAVLKDYYISAGQGCARYENMINLNGINAQFDMGMSYILEENAHHDMTFQIRHNNTDGTSHAMARSLLRDKANAVTQGKIYVAPGAQKTDSQEMFNAILLSDTCRYLTKPELEIYADDVVCGHGATVSDFDEEAYFYLASRGINHETAKKILSKAFLAESFDKIDNKNITYILDTYMTSFLERQYNTVNVSI